jgi:hypothetical protein
VETHPYKDQSSYHSEQTGINFCGAQKPHKGAFFVHFRSAMLRRFIGHAAFLQAVKGNAS